MGIRFTYETLTGPDGTLDISHSSADPDVFNVSVTDPNTNDYAVFPMSRDALERLQRDIVQLLEETAT